jgi:hypothetical protein
MSTLNITLVARFEENITACIGSPVAIEFAVLTHPDVLAVTVDDIGSDDRIPLMVVRVRYAGGAPRFEVEALAREAAPVWTLVSAVRLEMGDCPRGWSEDHARPVDAGP